MSHLEPKLAALVGGVAVLALLGISTDAEAARKKPVAKSQTQSNAVRSSYGYQPRSYNIQPSVGSYGPAPGTGILHGGPASGSFGPGG